MEKRKCYYCGSEFCYTNTYHREMPTTTFLPPGMTLEQIMGVMVETLNTMPYCKTGQEHYSDFHPYECHDHHHTPNIIDALVNALRKEIQPKCIKIPTLEEIHSESCKQRAEEIYKNRDSVARPFWNAIDEALHKKGYNNLGLEVYSKVAKSMENMDWQDDNGEYEKVFISRILEFISS